MMLELLIAMIILSIFGSFYRMKGQESADAMWRQARKENDARLAQHMRNERLQNEKE